MAEKKKKRRRGLRVDIIALVSVLILLVTFFAYMLNTTLEDVLERERGSGVIITHTDNSPTAAAPEANTDTE